LLTWCVGAGWYAVALLTAPLLMAATLLTLSLSSPAFLPGIFTSDDKASLLLVGLAVGLSAGVFEEPGWTGLAIPTLRRRYGVLATGLIVGVWWSAWHLLPNIWSSRAASGELAVSVFLSATAVSVFVGYQWHEASWNDAALRDQHVEPVPGSIAKSSPLLCRFLFSSFSDGAIARFLRRRAWLTTMR
jgi:membrane protease YdiL (CAAX protease family)